MPRLNPIALLAAAAFFMELLDGSIINTALPSIAQSFGTDPVSLNPAVSAYLLTVAVLILPSGWLADRLGPRPVFTAAIATFGAASLLCSLCTSPTQLVAARVLQGVGGAMMVPVGRLVVLRTTPKPDLIRAIATLTWPGLTAPVLGPPLGGFLTQALSWHWVFLINLPLSALGVLLAWRLVPALPTAERPPFDTPGFLLAATLVAALTWGLDSAGAGASPALLAAYAAATVALAAALARHLRRTPHPIIGLAPLRVPTYRFTVTGGSAMRTLISAMPFMLPLLFQLRFGLDPLQAGTLVLALFAGNIGIKPLTTPILRRHSFRTIMLANGLLQAATMLAAALLTPGTPHAAVAALLVLSGASRSMQFTALNTLAFADVPEPAMTGANTLFSLAFQFSNGMGVALGALLLRLTGTFPAAFTGLAALMLAATLTSLRLPHAAGNAVRLKNA